MIATAGLVLLAMLGVPAAPGATPTPDPRIGQAFQACQKGEVDTGVEILGQLYAESRNLEYVVAQGRCLQKNGRPNEALRYYREYLRIGKDAAPEQRERVLGYQKEAEQEAQSLAPARVPTPEPTPPAIPPPSVPVVVAPQPVQPAPVSPALEISKRPALVDEVPPFYRRTWFLLGAGAVVVAAVATAVVFATTGGTTTAPLCPDCTSTTGVGTGR